MGFEAFPMFLAMALWASFPANGVVDTAERVDGLELHFYRDSCPSAEVIVKQKARTSMVGDPSTVAALLRLAFHDCRVDVVTVGRCDVSVLLGDSSSLTNETLSKKNFGIRKLDTIDEIKSSLENVSSKYKGPYIEVLTGRRDTLAASKERADEQLPKADISVDELIKIFGQKNIFEEGVALIGAHALGVGHCRNFENRLRPRADPAISPSHAFVLKTIYSGPSVSDIAFATNDATAISFDNRYFMDTLNGRELLKFDSDISRDPRTLL
ncbi:peroxidase 29-like [Vitis riparia]|uniref:peroxidase 29-like n=1 Tax=Vitis riparia TaxID=96939 RepID=UPI00155A82B7|nr:peroxidase 29-like [Vitis riparia]